MRYTFERKISLSLNDAKARETKTPEAWQPYEKEHFGMITNTRRKFIQVFGALIVSGVSISHVLASEASKDEKRSVVRKMSRSVLRRLYKLQPTSRHVIASAAGYGVFSNFGMKLFFAGGGSGEGLVVDNSNRHETFMKMFELQAGLGFGIKKFSVVFVFETAEALKGFVDSGWEFGGQATAAVTLDGKGRSLQGAVSVAPGIWLYQLTESGLALELTAKGTKYYKDDDLN